MLDFGIARLTAVAGDTAATAPLTDTGDVLGTPAYMAPEQVFGEKDVDTRADIWSFGVLLYECLSGTKPFVGDNFGQIFKQVAMGEITPIERHDPDLPPALARLIMKMLARESRGATERLACHHRRPPGRGVTCRRWRPRLPRAARGSFRCSSRRRW